MLIFQFKNLENQVFDKVSSNVFMNGQTDG